MNQPPSIDEKSDVKFIEYKFIIEFIFIKLKHVINEINLRHIKNSIVSESTDPKGLDIEPHGLLRWGCQYLKSTN